MERHSVWLSQSPSSWRSSSPSSWSVVTSLKIWTWESESQVVVPPTKSTLSDKLSPRDSSPSTRSTTTNSQRESSRKCSSNTTRPSSSLIPEDAKPRSSVVQVPDLDSKSLTDEHKGRHGSLELNLNKTLTVGTIYCCFFLKKLYINSQAFYIYDNDIS